MSNNTQTQIVNIVGMLWIATLVLLGTFGGLLLTKDSPAAFAAFEALGGSLAGMVIAHYFAMRQAAQGGQTAINAMSSTTVSTPDMTASGGGGPTTMTNSPAVRQPTTAGQG